MQTLKCLELYLVSLFILPSLIFYLLESIHLITNRGTKTREERKMRCHSLRPDVLTFSILFFSLILRPRKYNDVTFHLHAKYLPTMREEEKKAAKIKLLDAKKVADVCRLGTRNREHCPGWRQYFTSSTIFSYRVLSRN